MRTFVHEAQQSFLDPLERADHKQHEFPINVPVSSNGGIDHSYGDEPASILTIPSPDHLAEYLRAYYSNNEIAQLISLLRDGVAS